MTMRSAGREEAAIASDLLTRAVRSFDQSKDEAG
jgi:hypothetical protein